MNTRALLVIWIAFSIAYAVSLVLIQRIKISNELELQSSALTNQASQRADQHDAHLTGLAALAISEQEPNSALFLEVVASINQFYPRVMAVDLVSLQDVKNVISSRDGASDTFSLYSSMQAAAVRSTGNLELIRSPQHVDRYLIVKRVPNTSAARFALAFEVDTAQLVKNDVDFWKGSNTELIVSLPNGHSLSRPTDMQSRQTFLSKMFAPLAVVNTLQSRSQPLQLTSIVRVNTKDYLPVGPLIAGIATLGLSLLIVASLYRLYSTSRQAEKRALLGEHEARISRASRINSLGELSSGIAHELTQPLTAILSQSQAGLRLLEPVSTNEETLMEILNANVAQAKRASNILARLRTWTTRTGETAEPVRVNACVQNVLLLLDAEIANLSINLSTELSANDPFLFCDPVEFEQVVFNLIRNALDKAPMKDSASISVLITTTIVKNQVILKVEDNGAPVDEKMLERIFEPFVTNRDSGMGLGLALCERIVSRMDGHIEIFNAEGGVVARVAVPEHLQGNKNQGG